MMSMVSALQLAPRLTAAPRLREAITAGWDDNARLGRPRVAISRSTASMLNSLPDELQSFVCQVRQVDTDASADRARCNHTFSSGACKEALSCSRIRTPQIDSKRPAEFIYCNSVPYRFNHCLAILSLTCKGGVWVVRNTLQSLYADACSFASNFTMSPYFPCNSAALDTMMAPCGLMAFFNHFRNTPSGTSIGGCLSHNAKPKPKK